MTNDIGSKATRTAADGRRGMKRTGSLSGFFTFTASEIRRAFLRRSTTVMLALIVLASAVFTLAAKLKYGKGSQVNLDDIAIDNLFGSVYYPSVGTKGPTPYDDEDSLTDEEKEVLYRTFYDTFKTVQFPSFMGGMDAYVSFIRDELGYPATGWRSALGAYLFLYSYYYSYTVLNESYKSKYGGSIPDSAVDAREAVDRAYREYRDFNRMLAEDDWRSYLMFIRQRTAEDRERLKNSDVTFSLTLYNADLYVCDLYLENNIKPYEYSWKDGCITRIQELYLADPVENNGEINRYLYFLRHGIKTDISEMVSSTEYRGNNFWGIFNAGLVSFAVAGAVIIYFAARLLSRDFSEGTGLFAALLPFGRRSKFFGKCLTLTVFGLAATAVSFLSCFLFSMIFAPNAAEAFYPVVKISGDNVIGISPLARYLGIYLLKFLSAFMFASLALAVSAFAGQRRTRSRSGSAYAVGGEIGLMRLRAERISVSAAWCIGTVFAFGGKLAELMAARFPNFSKSCFAAFSMVANSDISGALLPGAMLGLGASLAVVLVHIAVFLLAAYDFEA